MKTTIDIPDALLDEARALALREGTTLKALVERGLRRVLDEGRSSKPFRLRRACVGGKGLQAGVREGDWERIRTFAYGEPDA